MPAPFTVILRFRDLTTGLGETIADHQHIAKTKGSVWWGWWHKYGEAIPDAAFRTLAKRAKTKAGLPVFLFDSGSLKTYRCLCRDLKWDPLHQKITTPDKNLTPAYYDQKPCLAWFSIVSFKEVSEQAIQKYSYERVDAFFSENISRYQSFYGKRVYNFDELKQQERTIWFVRPFREGDRSHRIELLDGAHTNPADFPVEYLQTPSATLIWTSDLHFGQQAFPANSSSHESDLAKAIENALEDQKIDRFGGHIISGDLTWKAGEDEFAQVSTFIHRLMGTPVGRNQAILLCPGNHDLVFSDTPENKGARIHDSIIPASARAAYAAFYEKLFYKQPNQFLSSGRKFLMAGCVPVEIVALNSSYLEQKKGWFQGHGFVGDDQLRHAASEMGWVGGGAPRPFRILVLHHHLMPVTFRSQPMGGYSYSVVLDAEAVVEWVVKYGVDLVLHGHMHRSFVARVSRPLDKEKLDGPWHTFHVAGLSSTGVSSKHADEKNSFACVTFGTQQVFIDWYSIHPVKNAKHIRKLTIERGAGS